MSPFFLCVFFLCFFFCVLHQKKFYCLISFSVNFKSRGVLVVGEWGLIFVDLLERQTDRALLSNGSLPRCFQQQRLGQLKARSQELDPGVLCG